MDSRISPTEFLDFALLSQPSAIREGSHRNLRVLPARLSQQPLLERRLERQLDLELDLERRLERRQPSSSTSGQAAASIQLPDRRQLPDQQQLSDPRLLPDRRPLDRRELLAQRLRALGSPRHDLGARRPPSRARSRASPRPRRTAAARCISSCPRGDCDAGTLTNSASPALLHPTPACHASDWSFSSQTGPALVSAVHSLAQRMYLSGPFMSHLLAQPSYWLSPSVGPARLLARPVCWLFIGRARFSTPSIYWPRLLLGPARSLARHIPWPGLFIDHSLFRFL